MRYHCQRYKCPTTFPIAVGQRNLQRTALGEPADQTAWNHCLTGALTLAKGTVRKIHFPWLEWKIGYRNITPTGLDRSNCMVKHAFALQLSMLMV